MKGRMLRLPTSCSTLPNEVEMRIRNGMLMNA